jgi:general secretion pathway protein K
MAAKYASSYRQSASRPRPKVRGSILMLVLWSFCLLAAFAVILGYEVRQKASLIKRLDERDRSRFIAEAGARKAISELKKEQVKSYDSLNDKWSNNPAAFKDIGVGGGTADISYNYTDTPSGDLEVRYGLVDEESKININNINDTNKADMLQVLQRLFVLVLNYNEAQAQELAASFIDWRDADDNLTVAFGSAEDSYYTGLVYPYKAKNAALEVLEELILVKGMDENIFGKIRNYVTIYGGGRVNINTTSKIVLSALGLSEDIINKIIAFRAGDDGITGTADDNIFSASSDIVPQLSQFGHLSASEIAQLSTVVNQYLDVKSGFFSVDCRVKLNKNSIVNEMHCILNRNGKILYWREP